MKPCSVIILCSGKSERMGFPKVLLPFNESDTFLSYLLQQYQFVTQNIVVVVTKDLFKFIQLNKKKYIRSSVSYVINEYPNKGKIYSIQLGLNYIHTNYIFLQNVDTPFVTKKLLTQMLSLIEPHKYVVPIVQSRKGHPLLIHKSIADRIATILSDDFNLHLLLQDYQPISCPTSDANVLLNINTPTDYCLSFNKEFFSEEWL